MTKNGIKTTKVILIIMLDFVQNNYNSLYVEIESNLTCRL